MRRVEHEVDLRTERRRHQERPRAGAARRRGARDRPVLRAGVRLHRRQLQGDGLLRDRLLPRAAGRPVQHPARPARPQLQDPARRGHQLGTVRRQAELDLHPQARDHVVRRQRTHGRGLRRDDALLRGSQARLGLQLVLVRRHQELHRGRRGQGTDELDRCEAGQGQVQPGDPDRRADRVHPVGLPLHHPALGRRAEQVRLRHLQHQPGHLRHLRAVRADEVRPDRTHRARAEQEVHRPLRTADHDADRQDLLRRRHAAALPDRRDRHDQPVPARHQDRRRQREDERPAPVQESERLRDLVLVLRHHEAAVRQRQGASGPGPLCRPRPADQQRARTTRHPRLRIPDPGLPVRRRGSAEAADELRTRRRPSRCSPTPVTRAARASPRSRSAGGPTPSPRQRPSSKRCRRAGTRPWASTSSSRSSTRPRSTTG